VPLEPFTDDASFLEVFDLVVPASLRAFRPDLIVVQAGADTHRHDPLADLGLSLVAWPRATGAWWTWRARSRAEGWWSPVAAATTRTDTVPRAWAHAWAALAGRDLPTALPAAWVERWSRELGHPMPRTSHENADEWPAQPRREAIARRNRTVAERALATLEGIWRARRGVTAATGVDPAG
jgi:acetoin utilization protein AcuC